MGNGHTEGIQATRRVLEMENTSVVSREKEMGGTDGPGGSCRKNLECQAEELILWAGELGGKGQTVKINKHLLSAY